MIGGILNSNQCLGGESCHMIDENVLDRHVDGDNRKEIAKPFVGLAVNVIHNQIMDTVTLSSRGGGPKPVQRDCDLQYAATMSNFVVANGDVGDAAERTGIVLVGWCQQNCKAALTKTTPNIFEHVALE